MKKKFLESFINSQINYNGDFNKIKKRLIYNYEKKNRKMLFGRKLKLCLYLSGVLILMFFIIIHFPKDVLANVLNYYSVSFDDKMGEKIRQNYYQKGEIVNLPILSRDGYYFVGWKDISNDILYSSDETEIISIIVNNNIKLEAEWIKLIHDFNGINYKIIVDDKSKYDPFDNSYVKDDKVLRQNHQKLVENEFNIKIIYVEYDPFKDEMDLIEQIRMHIVDLQYYKTNVFAAVLPSKTLSYLGAYQYVADLNEDDEISDKVYGYKNTSNFGEQYMFYNKTKLTELGIEDPLIMWMKGKWTQSNFKAWVETASGKLLNEEYVLDFNYSDYILGTAAASGISITNPIRSTVNLASRDVINIYTDIKYYYNNGLWNNRESDELVSSKFKEGKTLIHSGYLYYLNNDKYFDTNIDFEIGVIPYPIKDESDIVMTSPFKINLATAMEKEYNKPIEINNQILKNDSGESIYGVNVSKSAYKNRYLEGSVYDFNSSVALLNFNYEDFTKKDIFKVILALSHFQKNISETDEFIEYLKANKLSELNIDVILSTQVKEVIEEEILPQLDVTLKVRNTTTSLNNLSSISHYVVTNDQSVSSMLRDLQYAYKKLMN